MSDDDYSEEEISIEEKTNIVRYFVNNSPPGHADKVIEACKTIGAADVLTEDQVQAMKREYDLSNFKPIHAADGLSAVVCIETEVAAGEFLNVTAGKVLAYDHVTGKVGAARDASEEEVGNKASTLAKDVQAFVDTYLAKAYQPGDSASTVLCKDDGSLFIAISAEKIKHEGGCWSGQWKSEWSVEAGSINGTASIMSHYYEEGNVQMHNLKDFEPTQIKEDAKAIAKHIEKSEATLHKAFDKMYKTMSTTTFKELRRMLPVTATKFNWSDAGASTMRQVLRNNS
jgi:capping protein alpha